MKNFIFKNIKKFILRKDWIDIVFVKTKFEYVNNF